jgi:hypothetical protein
MMTSASCATSGGGNVNLPPWPSDFQPVTTATPQSGSDAKAALAVCVVETDDANDIIEASGKWYENLRASYASK